MLRRIEAQLHDTVSLTHLRSADPQQLGAIIQYEHPQIMAVVLTYLDSAQTAAVIREIDTMQGSDVLMRMARMKKVMPDVLRIIEASLGTDSDLSLKGEVDCCFNIFDNSLTGALSWAFYQSQF